KHFSLGLVKTFIDTLLNSTLGLPLAEIQDFSSKIKGVIELIIDLTTGHGSLIERLTNSFKTLLVDVLDLLPQNIADEVDKIVSIISFGYSIIQDIKDDPQKLIDYAKSFLEELIPQDVQDRVNKVKQAADTIIEIIGKIREDGISTLSAVNQLIDTIFTDFTTIPNDLMELLKNTTRWVFGVLNDGLTNTLRNNLPSLNDIIFQALNWINNQLPSADKISTGIIDMIRKTMDGIMGFYSFIKNFDEQAARLYAKSKDLFKDFIDNPVEKLMPIMKIIFGETSDIVTNYLPKIEQFAELAINVFKILSKADLSSFQSIIQFLISFVGTGFLKNFDITIDPFIKIIKYLFPSILGVDSPPSPTQAVQEIISLLPDISVPGLGTPLKDVAETILGIVFSAREIFTNGLQWLFGQVIEWLARQVEQLVSSLLNSLVGLVGGSISESHNLVHGYKLTANDTILDRGYLTSNGTKSKLTSGMSSSLLDFSISPEFGDMSIFKMYLSLGLKLNFGFDTSAFKDFLIDVIFNGRKLFEDGIGAFFLRLFSFFEISPVLTASIEIGGFGTGKNGFMNFLLEALGLKLDFKGGGFFAMNILTFKGGQFKKENFLKILEWGLTFTLTLEKEFSLIDFLTGGLGGGILSSVAEYLGLNLIKVTIIFGLTIEVIKKSTGEASFTLKNYISALIELGFDLAIVGISLWGGVDIVFSLFQDLKNREKPMEILFTVTFFFGVKFKFLFWDWDDDWDWTPVYEDLSPNTKGELEANGAKGFDEDGDGLGDDYEQSYPGLNYQKADSDDDGIDDKMEIQTTATDPSKADTDGDGLSDKTEIENTKTDPNFRDSDYDGLSDFVETEIYFTNPLQRDTDGDGLDDHFEVMFRWNISTITRSVPKVIIGGIAYTDHTDPLNPDTDEDGLLDGQEGERGPFYGNESLRQPALDPQYDIVFGGGYTHPLDNDTDDDSYEQILNGTVSPRRIFMRDMSDGILKMLRLMSF
ncbi:MAG: hypothetical protein ACXAD7_14080, partial [Candidatus Kariarchaeaceae archaeon]